MPSPVAGVKWLALAMVATHLQSAATAFTRAGVTSPPRVDVGFVAFEGNLTEEVTKDLAAAALHNASKGGPWTDEMRKAVQANVSTCLRQGLQDAFAPVKKSIAHTWMALGEPERKEAYVDQMRSALSPVFEASLRSVADHLKLTMQRVESLPGLRHMSNQELVAESSGIISDSLLAEHCYGEETHTHTGFLQSVPKTRLSHFCLPSLVTGFARRVNDTQGLLSMTMRFEAGAMSLAQQAKQNASRTLAK
mmetsp:Transcript_73863/g.175826  ORF Transcript_73863/g.175826 Transcript_73863/m.175826 type:complete len:250 (+) Transcript_73863:79-828(+)